MTKFRVASLSLVALACLSGCGYHVTGNGDLMPKTLSTIYIPAFTNQTSRYRLSDHLPEEIAREFIARTRYSVVPNAEAADAILTGNIANYTSYPTIFDAGTTNRPGTGRASAVQVSVRMSVTLTERKTGKVLYTNPSFEARQRYEISIDPKAYFEESETALDRLAHDVAKSVVSAILENF